jgi:D-xylose transport system permease protein
MVNSEGRGEPMIHALLGGVVIATVFNGLALMGISAAGVDIATAIVLMLAVTVDSVVRRRGDRPDAGRDRRLGGAPPRRSS